MTSGIIIDRLDQVSKQTDVIIYDALNCPVYRASEQAAIVPNENVAAVIAVKSYLDKEKLLDACSNLSAAKKLAKLKAPAGARVLTATFGGIFAFDSAIKLDTLADHYTDVCRDLADSYPPADVIAVLDKGVISFFSKLQQRDGWSAFLFGDGPGLPEFEGAHVAIGTQPLGVETLDWFFRWLLAHLSLFRGVVDHPGFNWKPGVSRQFRLQYVGSVTHEQDPERRKELLKRYANNAKTAFMPTREDGDIKRGDA